MNAFGNIKIREYVVRAIDARAKVSSSALSSADDELQAVFKCSFALLRQPNSKMNINKLFIFETSQVTDRFMKERMKII